MTVCNICKALIVRDEWGGDCVDCMARCGDPDAIAEIIGLVTVGPIRDQWMIILPYKDVWEVLYRTRRESRLVAVQYALARAYGERQQDWPQNDRQLFDLIQYGDTDWMVRTDDNALYSSADKVDAEMVLQACRRMASIAATP